MGTAEGCKGLSSPSHSQGVLIFARTNGIGGERPAEGTVLPKGGSSGVSLILGPRDEKGHSGGGGRVEWTLERVEVGSSPLLSCMCWTSGACWIGKAEHWLQREPGLGPPDSLSSPKIHSFTNLQDSFFLLLFKCLLLLFIIINYWNNPIYNKRIPGGSPRITELFI